MASVGELIRSERLAAGLTQDALAAAIGCSKSQLSLMESGDRTISAQRAALIERALGIADGRLTAAIHWQQTPQPLRDELTATLALREQLLGAIRKRGGLDALYRSGQLTRLVKRIDPDVTPPLPLGSRIPVINRVAAGYPREFTDLDYPRSVADDYIACPDVTDPDAFAARVVGDSMEPEYREGEIVVFSPQRPTPSGCDCFVRLERDNETTFKRIYVEDDGRSIRLQPLNPTYPPRVVNREEVSGLYAAAYVMRKVGA
jgi:repressor LexA